MVDDPEAWVTNPPMLKPDEILKLAVPLDPAEFVVIGLDVSKAPEFGTQELGTIFFQRSAAWIRWVDRRGQLDKDNLGRTVTPTRLINPKNGIKRYTLADVEMTARILHQNGVIASDRLQIALQIIFLLAVGYGVITVEIGND